MGNCCSNPSTDSSPPPMDIISEEPRQAPLPQRGHDGPERTDSMPEPAGQVQPSESNPAPTPSQSDEKASQTPSRSVRDSPSSPLPLHKSISAYPSFDSVGTQRPATNEGAFQKAFPESGRALHPSYPRRAQRSASAYATFDNARNGPLPAPGLTPSSSLSCRHRHQKRAVVALDPQLTPRAAARAHNPRSFPSALRGVLPDGFRYAQRA